MMHGQKNIKSTG